MPFLNYKPLVWGLGHSATRPLANHFYTIFPWALSDDNITSGKEIM